MPTTQTTRILSREGYKNACRNAVPASLYHPTPTATGTPDAPATVFHHTPPPGILRRALRKLIP